MTPLSPESALRALRAAELKKRFADTILRAGEKISDIRGHKTSDPQKTSQKEIEFKAQVEAELSDAKAAVANECEMLRARKRAKARLAIEGIKKTVEFQLDTQMVDEIQRLAWFSSCVPSLLEKLGLRIKPEYSLGEDGESFLAEEEREEGEIYAKAAVVNECEMLRARKRAEARLAVDRIKKTVEFQLDTQMVDEIQRLAWFSSCVPSPLEQLGLRIKPEYSLDDDGESFLAEEEREEGEIYGESFLAEEEREEREIYSESFLAEEEREEGEIYGESFSG